MDGSVWLALIATLFAASQVYILVSNLLYNPNARRKGGR